MPPASATRLLGEVKRVTPGTWQVAAWSHADGATLEVTFQQASADTASLVAAWEDSPLFEAVAPADGNVAGGTGLQARITPLDAQAP